MRFRFKLRWAMVAVAIAALLCGPGYRYLEVLRSRSQHYRGMAQWQELQAKANFDRSKNMGWDEGTRERSKRVGEWYLKRRDIYLRAARFPVYEVPVEWEPWATVPYRQADGFEWPRADPAVLWPRNKEEEKKQAESIAAAEEKRRAEERRIMSAAPPPTRAPSNFGFVVDDEPQ